MRTPKPPDLIWIKGLLIVNHENGELWIGTPPECENLSKEDVQKLADYISEWLDNV
jgi:hypothetical protein